MFVWHRYYCWCSLWASIWHPSSMANPFIHANKASHLMNFDTIVGEHRPSLQSIWCNPIACVLQHLHFFTTICSHRSKTHWFSGHYLFYAYLDRMPSRYPRFLSNNARKGTSTNSWRRLAPHVMILLIKFVVSGIGKYYHLQTPRKVAENTVASVPTFACLFTL